MLYDENFTIYKQEKTNDGLGGHFTKEVPFGTIKAKTIPMAMEFQLTESNRTIKDIRRLVTEDNLPINFQDTKASFTLREDKTEYVYSVTSVINLGRETALILRRDS